MKCVIVYRTDTREIKNTFFFINDSSCKINNTRYYWQHQWKTLYLLVSDSSQPSQYQAILILFQAWSITLLTHGRECVWSGDRGASCLNQSVEAPTVTARSPLVSSRDLRISNRISLGIKQSLMRTFKAPLGQAPGYTSECTSKNKTTDS